MRLKLVNNSKWSTPALKIIARWVARTAGIKWAYRVTVGRTSGWYGRGGRNSQRSYMNRNYKRINSRTPGTKPEWPYTFSDRRFQGGVETTVNNRLELLVWLLLHEACHATHGHPNRHEHGRLDRKGMESVCNRFANRTLIEFREAWTSWMKRDVVAAMRETRARKVKARVMRGDPAPILQSTQLRLDAWESKLKYVQRKIVKYRRKLKYYQGRMAAWSSGKQ